MNTGTTGIAGKKPFEISSYSTNMWHEARKQEKFIRTTMIDQSKRAERKRKYFENVRKDPAHFLQIHGHKSHIYADLNIVKAAEDSNILRSWQGDPNITIDRFDARSHLTRADLMDEDEPIPKKASEVTDEKEDLVCEFERYRILIINEFKSVSEKSHLKKIVEHEYYQQAKDTNRKAEQEKKRKNAEKKSNIGFNYEDSETVKGGNHSEEESEDDGQEFEDLEVDVDVTILNAETQRRLSKIGEEFGVKRGLFCPLLRADRQAMKDAAELKQIDRQKAQLSGRESKHERQLLRKQRAAIIGKSVVVPTGATATLLGFINESNKKTKIDEIMSDLDKKDRDVDKAKPEFITSFGGEGNDNDSDGDTVNESHGPQLPSQEYLRILKLSKNRDNGEEVDWSKIKKSNLNSRCDSRSRSRERYRSRSPIRRSRSRSPVRRSRSRSRDRSRRKRSRSRTNNSRKKSRSHSREKRVRKRSRSVSRRRYRSRSRSPRYDRRSRNGRFSKSPSRERNRSRRSEKGRDRPMFGRKTRSRSSSPKERSIPIEVDKNEKSSEDEDVKMIEIRSSMSESEKERIEIENRKRRVKLTKKMVKEKQKGNVSSSSDEEDNPKNGEAQRIKERMNKTLKKRRAELEKETEEKRKEADLEQRVREELRYIEEQERRERERKKRRRSGSRSPKRTAE